MPEPKTRRRFIQSSAIAGGIAVAGCLSGDGEEPEGDSEPDPDSEPEADDEPEDDEPEPEPEPTYEVWAADQGTSKLYVYEGGYENGDEGDDGHDLELVDEVDTGAEGGDVPHMISYSSDYEYVLVPCTAGGRTLVYRTEDRELVANLETGAGSHFAGFTPDDEYVVVDVIGESEIVRVDADLDTEEFEIEDRIEVTEEIEGLTEEEGAPICHSYDHEGRSIHTLGPSYHDAGLLVVDHEEFEVDQAFPGDEIPTNCGTMPHYEDDKFYLTAGLPSDPDADPEEDPEAAEGVGEYYVYDTAEDEVATQGSTGGVDAHGFWYTTDGEELWVLNRETNDGVILDPETDQVIEEIDQYIPGDNEKPDIMWASPDGEYMFVTARGPEPVSAAHVAEGDTPGFSVIDTETREIVDVVEPDPIDDYSEEEIEDPDVLTPDFHGIGVRPLAEFPEAITSPPF